MRGDFSRLTFDDAHKHYAGVLHQQGRVWLDTDWNADVFDRIRLLQQETRDIVGECGVPDPGTAFAITVNSDSVANPLDFQISGGDGPLGRYYVDGILANLDRPVTYQTQPDYPDPPAISTDGIALDAVVYLEVWRQLVTFLEDDAIWEPALGGPDTATRLKTIAQVKVVAAPAGITVSCATAGQYLPVAGQGTLTTIQPQDTQPPDLCRIPDPANYTGRENHLYRVEIHDGGDVLGVDPSVVVTVLLGQDAAAGSTSLTLASPLTSEQRQALKLSGSITITQDGGPSETADVASAADTTITLMSGTANAYSSAKHAAVTSTGAGFAFTTINLGADAAAGAVTLTLAAPLSAGQLSALRRSGVVTLAQDGGQTERIDVAIDVASATPTTIPLATGIAGAYTVANHAAVTGGVARFKWSRDNASFAVSVTDVAVGRQSLTLASLGRDQATALRQGDLVEIDDDASELGPGRGFLTTLSDDPDPDQLTAPLSDPLPTNFQVGRHLVLRRWDGLGVARAAFDAATTPDLDFGDGVHIQFGGSDMRPGDYWTFAARSIDGSVEPLADAPPAGIKRSSCPLAVLHYSQVLGFDFADVVKNLQEARLTEQELHAAEEVRTRSRKAFWTSAEHRALAQQVGATADQLTSLDEVLTRPAPGLQKHTVVNVEDCRTPFDPLTSRRCACSCDCTVTIRPGDSLAAAIDKVGPEGGVVCLLPGLHVLSEMVHVKVKHGLTIRGAGAASVVSVPSAPISLLFEACNNLTLEEFAVTGGGAIKPPAADGVPAAFVSYPGVVTFLGCREVRVSGCLVDCQTLSAVGSPSARSCMTFLGLPVEAPQVAIAPAIAAQPVAAPPRIPDTLIASLARLRASPELMLRPAAAAVAAPGVVAIGAGSVAASPPQAAAALPADTSARPDVVVGPVWRERGTVDITVRDCRFVADPGNVGVLVSAGLGVSIEDSWALSTAVAALLGIGLDRAASGKPALGAAVPVPAPAPAAGTPDTKIGGIVVIQCDRVALLNNIVIGFQEAAILSGTEFHIQGNTVAICETGADVSSVTSFCLDRNFISASPGPAVTITSAAGEVALHGNLLICSSTGASSVGVASITARSATLVENSFLTTGDAGFREAVAVRAQYIIYTANRSVCQALPLLTNVLLAAGVSPGAPSAITAIGNTCLEPLPNEAGDFGKAMLAFEKEALALEGEQEKLLQAFSSGQLHPGQFLERMQALEEQWKIRDTALAEVLKGHAPEGQRLSLLAVAGAAVTGMNLLSYNLGRFGRGSDQGTLTGVF